MPEIDTSGMPEAEGAQRQWRSFLDRNQSIVVQVIGCARIPECA
jgi:hypothetical protein